ncbi:uncharacterized protein BT62DRAFT_1077290 [Guyanagaster necrorhizus]|uniref:RING-type domain-containing protein n=1 Tax=Guyanagaster necrorhizus TaxID=856835 RepID=A0A9P8AR65_9AGAR|nr:uncharacterized protein BT62DRAFT_1077290 [Guyanagaster necrorhizus MCA 3950]KAG7445083.1 hypothetical protein BT62DRAFT_1077290 [Guyanagaster necrorhizus MCA 3950]
MSTSCVCSICLSDFVDPVCTPCGHVYCSRCIVEATSVQRDEGYATAPCPTCRKPFSIADDPLSQDFQEYFGHPLRRLYVNGLRVNFEDKVKRLEQRIATLERENQRIRMLSRYMRQKDGDRSVPWLARTPRSAGLGFPSQELQEHSSSRIRWLANGFLFGVMVLVGSVAGLALYDAFGRYTR